MPRRSIIAKEKGFFAKHGVPDMDIAKQASWGATRDNMALGTKANGIDGGHILRPKTHLYSTGKVMQNSQPLPMYTLLNLNEDCQAISVSNEFKDLKVGTDASRAEGSVRQEEGRRQGGEGRHDLPRRHARPVDPLLARCRRHRSRQGRLDHRRAAAADGGQHEGRHHGRVLRRRAVERAARQPGHRLHRRDHRRDLVQAPREDPRHARRLGRCQSEARRAPS